MLKVVSLSSFSCPWKVTSDTWRPSVFQLLLFVTPPPHSEGWGEKKEGHHLSWGTKQAPNMLIKVSARRPSETEVKPRKRSLKKSRFIPKWKETGQQPGAGLHVWHPNGAPNGPSFFGLWSQFLWAKGLWGLGMARPLVRCTHSTAEALRSSFRRPVDQREEACTEPQGWKERWKEPNSIPASAARFWFPFPAFLWGVGLVFQGCCVKRVAHTGWLRTTEIRFQFWRPEDWNEGVKGQASSWLLMAAGKL